MPLLFAPALAALALFTAMQPHEPSLLAWFAGLFVILWLYALVVDTTVGGRVLWAPLIAVTAWLALGFSTDAPSARDVVLCSLVTLWAVTNAIAHHRRGGETDRVAALRKVSGDRWPLVSFVSVYLPGLVFAWSLTAPLVAALDQPSLASRAGIEWLGAALWAIGIILEAQAPKTRNHPLAPLRCTLVHWGFACFAAAGGQAEFLAIPALVTVASFAHAEGAANRGSLARRAALVFALRADR